MSVPDSPLSHTGHTHDLACPACVNDQAVNLQLLALLGDARDANAAGDRGTVGLLLAAMGQQVSERAHLVTRSEQ